MIPVPAKKKTTNHTVREFTDEDISDYPAHVESFETYYWLGEGRTLREVAEQRFPYLVPNYPIGHPEHARKFESFYTKIKRWASKERWNDWVKRKEIEERSKREDEMRDKVIKSTKTLVYYRGILQQGLSAFGRKVAWATRLINEIVGLEETSSKEEDAARKEAMITRIGQLRNELAGRGIEINNFNEAVKIIQLDVELGKYLEAIPEVQVPDKMKLEEVEMKKIDDIMEAIRRKARDAGASVKENNEGGNNAD